MDARGDFVERHARAILDLPQDVKAVCEVLDDEELPPERRRLVAGALVGLLQAGDLVPDTWGPLGLVDDAIALRLAADAAVPSGSPERDRHATRFPPFWTELPDDLATARAFLGDTFVLFETRLNRLPLAEHKGKRAETAVHDETVRAWLYDELDQAMTDLELTDDELHVAMRRIDALRTHLRRRLAHR
ncbi:MAG: hypothetical protein JXB32_19050 [Deltaproteobacteria bacterium]|nr:hypothetical protein [Deltaproteobacteria bacterium]